MGWNFEPNIGLVSLKTNIKLHFGLGRNELRNLLKFEDNINEGRFKREDSYRNLFGINNWVRLSFNANDELAEIEVLEGTVSYKNIEIEVSGNLKKTKSEFEKLGFDFIENDCGFVCSELKFDLGDSDKNSGEENQISWFYTARDISHLLE